MEGGRADRDVLPKGPSGRSLCRWCNVEVPSGRLTFCSEWCVEEWKLRTDPGHLRQRVFERDRGICAICHLDCVAELNHLKRLRGGARGRALNEWKLTLAGTNGLRRRQRKPAGRTSLWDADHIVPVVEGGGECDLSNMRTLCLKCHRARTEELRQRLRGRTESWVAAR